MDIYSLVAANTGKGARREPMNARAEDRYYSEQITLPRLSAGVFRSIAIIASVIVVLGIPLI